MVPFDGGQAMRTGKTMIVVGIGPVSRLTVPEVHEHLCRVGSIRAASTD